MFGFTGWFQAFFEMLMVDDLAAGVLLATMGGSLVARVALIEADVTVAEALSYARVLLDLGEDSRAGELAQIAMTASFSREG